MKLSTKLIFVLVYTLQSLYSLAQDPMNIRLFEEGENKVLLKVSGKLLDHNLSGILILKQMSTQEIRAVMTMETGIKVYDVSISQKKMRLLESMPAYKSPWVKNILFKDLALILHYPFTNTQSKDSKEFKRNYEYSKQEEFVYRKAAYRGNKILEYSLKYIDSTGKIIHLKHNFNNIPYQIEYWRIENN